MKRTYRILPVYSGDCSGVCSALYELGGMVVIHDPSGCNSTYNTHDENRWYKRRSLIFISGLKESDAVMGNDRKFIDDVVAAARQLSPKFIALTNSPIPYINGTDFKAISRIIESETGIPTFYVKANGMHDYTFGASLAFEAYAKAMITGRENDRSSDRPAEAEKPLLNIIGATPLDFWDMNSINVIRANLEKFGWQINICYAMEAPAEEGMPADRSELFYTDMSDADPGRALVNLVVSGTGLRMARELEKTFGTPYVAGIPAGRYGEILDRELRKAAGIYSAGAGTLENEEPPADRNASSGRSYIVGESVVMGSIAAAINLEYGTDFQVISPVETGKDPEAVPAGAKVICRHVVGEEGTEEFLADAERVIGDPLYRHICRPDAEFTELPDLAFSGRCFRKKMKNIMNPEEYYGI